MGRTPYLSVSDPRKLTFIIGVEGSGTTMMSRLLGQLPQIEVLLGNHTTIEQDSQSFPEVARLMQSVAGATKHMWDSLADFAKVEEAKTRFQKQVQALRMTSEMQGVSHLVLKRSAPFFIGDRYRPDPFDVLDLIPDARLLIMTRQPAASTYSALRRGFVDNLRHGALICEHQLLLLAARVQNNHAPERLCVINYEAFCAEPEQGLYDIAEFVSEPVQSLLNVLQDFPVSSSQNELWRHELSDADQLFLERYFDERRIAQFNSLKLWAS